MRIALARLLPIVFVATPLLGGVAHAAAVAPGAIEIVSPRPGSELEAGGRAVIEWRIASPAAPDFEEWEAFLSLDGGRSWPVRLTQHLDGALRRVTVDLPAVPTPDARLLLRFGDERDEREMELAGTLSLVAPASRLTTDLRALPRLATRSGEAARPGVAGVSEWIEGPRDGSRSSRVRTAESGRLASGARFVRLDESFAALPPGSGPETPPPADTGRSISPPQRAPSSFTASPPSASSATQRLSILQRWNC